MRVGPVDTRLIHISGVGGGRRMNQQEVNIVRRTCGTVCSVCLTLVVGALLLALFLVSQGQLKVDDLLLVLNGLQASPYNPLAIAVPMLEVCPMPRPAPSQGGGVQAAGQPTQPKPRSSRWRGGTTPSARSESFSKYTSGGPTHHSPALSVAGVHGWQGATPYSHPQPRLPHPWGATSMAARQGRLHSRPAGSCGGVQGDLLSLAAPQQCVLRADRSEWGDFLDPQSELPEGSTAAAMLPLLLPLEADLNCEFHIKECLSEHDPAAPSMAHVHPGFLGRCAYMPHGAEHLKHGTSLRHYVTASLARAPSVSAVSAASAVSALSSRLACVVC